ncbi:MAG: DUF4337 domain-containing protein [Caulobacterales bacterium]|jgi:hypothetical protein
MADAQELAAPPEDHFTNRVALTVALLASFAALMAIQSGNVGDAREQAQAERNNSWAWYQAVRVREDMATYGLAHLQRLQRTATPAEAALLAGEITTQEKAVAAVRARKDEVEARAKAAEATFAQLNDLDDRFDLADALVAIGVTILAVAALAKVRWLYWFALLPGLGGVIWGATAIAGLPEPTALLARWLGVG